MSAMQEYKALVADISRRCDDITARYADQIVCTKGCHGNCCRIHLSIFPVEAFHLAAALEAQPAEIAQPIREQAHKTLPSGPCPLLAGAACRMYSDRLILCRTHGLPMQTRYRGSLSVGCCQKNFRKMSAIPDDACIDLDQLNKSLAAINHRFVSEYRCRYALKERYLIGEALTDISHQ